MEMMFMMWIWLAVIAVSAFLEAFSLQMVSIWFVPGGLVALILYFCGVGYEWQIVACIVVSLLLLLCLRKFCIKFMFKNKEGEKTNVDSLIGQVLPLREAITADQHGAVKIGDIVWSAVTEDESAISKGKNVEIVAVRGNKLIVKPAIIAKSDDSKKLAETAETAAEPTEAVAAEPEEKATEKKSKKNSTKNSEK